MVTQPALLLLPPEILHSTKNQILLIPGVILSFKQKLFPNNTKVISSCLKCKKVRNKPKFVPCF